MITQDIEQLAYSKAFYHMPNFIESSKEFFLKIEGLNIAGSIKLKTATSMVKKLIQENKIKNETKLVCSSSGNFGIAVSIICLNRKIPCICIIDVNTTPASEQLIKLYQAEIIKIKRKCPKRGFLGARLDYINELLKKHPEYIFLDQYSDDINIQTHESTTAKEIYDEFPNLDYLFVGASTTGTLMGCAQHFKRRNSACKIIAVDTIGSVIFGGKAGQRFLPGLGASIKPKITKPELIDDLVMVSELNSVSMCHQILNQYGLWIGASTGSVLVAVKNYQDRINLKSKIVAISPDLGGKYLDTVYEKNWMEKYNLFTIDQKLIC